VSASNDESPGLQRLRDAGIDLAGALAGGGIGLVGGPAGVFAGAAVGVAVTHTLRAVGEEIGERALAPRQQERVGALWLLVDKEIRERLARGEVPRQDWFEDQIGGIRSDAEELLEGALLHAADEYQESKLRYRAHLYAALCFRPDVSSGFAHYLLKLADQLTYRQYCMLALFADDRLAELRRDANHTHGSTEEGSNDVSRSRPHPGAIAELDQLGNQSVLGFIQEDTSVAHFAAVLGGGSFNRVSSKIGPTFVGTRLYDLLGLRDLLAQDVLDVLAELQGDSRGEPAERRSG
jgi:hypothetical protein